MELEYIGFLSHPGFSTDVPRDGAAETGGWSGLLLLAGSGSICRLPSNARGIRSCGRRSNGDSVAFSRGMTSGWPNCNACGEGSVCLTSNGRGNSLDRCSLIPELVDARALPTGGW